MSLFFDINFRRRCCCCLSEDENFSGMDHVEFLECIQLLTFLTKIHVPLLYSVTLAWKNGWHLGRGSHVEAVLGPHGHRREGKEAEDGAQRQKCAFLQMHSAYFCLQNWEARKLNSVKLHLEGF